MKVLKIILVVIVILVAVPLIAALFVKKDYKVEREVVVNKPLAEVFDYLKYLKNQDEYSVWAKLDPNMKKEYRGTDGEVGFVSAWESPKDDVGVGEQEIVAYKDGERVDLKIRFKKPFESEADAYFTTTAVDSASTKVLWGFSSTMPYPMNLMNLLMNMDEMIGKDLEGGLNNMKVIVEGR